MIQVFYLFYGHKSKCRFYVFEEIKNDYWSQAYKVTPMVNRFFSTTYSAYKIK